MESEQQTNASKSSSLQDLMDFAKPMFSETEHSLFLYLSGTVWKLNNVSQKSGKTVPERTMSCMKHAFELSTEETCLMLEIPEVELDAHLIFGMNGTFEDIPSEAQSGASTSRTIKYTGKTMDTSEPVSFMSTVEKLEDKHALLTLDADEHWDIVLATEDELVNKFSLIDIHSDSGYAMFRLSLSDEEEANLVISGSHELFRMS